MTKRLRTLADELHDQHEVAERARKTLAEARERIAELRPLIEDEVIASLKAGERVTDVAVASRYTRERIRQLSRKHNIESTRKPRAT